MSDAPPDAVRRVRIRLRRPAIRFWGLVRPTLVIGGVGQPAQWGLGTWQVPADASITLGAFVFARGWRFGAADVVLDPADVGVLEYRAPVVPFGVGRWVFAPE